jgi:hypothetical protein
MSSPPPGPWSGGVRSDFRKASRRERRGEAKVIARLRRAGAAGRDFARRRRRHAPSLMGHVSKLLGPPAERDGGICRDTVTGIVARAPRPIGAVSSEKGRQRRGLLTRTSTFTVQSATGCARSPQRSKKKRERSAGEPGSTVAPKSARRACISPLPGESTSTVNTGLPVEPGNDSNTPVNARNTV